MELHRPFTRVGCALLVFVLPQLAGVWLAKDSYQDELHRRIERAASESVAILDDLILTAEHNNLTLLPLLLRPCSDASTAMRLIAGKEPFVRSINLLRDEVIYCSSLYGNTAIRDNSITYVDNRLALVDGRSDNQMLQSMLLIRSDMENEAVVTSLNGTALRFILGLLDKEVSTWLQIGDQWLDSQGRVLVTSPFNHQMAPITINSKLYPLKLHAAIIGPVSWGDIWQYRKILFEALMLLSLVLSVTVHQLLGQPRSQRKKLLRALRKKEIIPYLQPIMSSDGTQLAGVELLARWQQPGGVMIPPDQFIPQMEDYGMIPAMTHMLMEEVAVQLAGHPNLHGLHIGINISASHCQDNALLRDCRQFLKAFKPGAVKLVLELTERQILLDDQHSHELFEELEEMGVELAIDDFGTGHSSLSYLLAFKVHTLKIDKAFVSLIGSPKKAACVAMLFT